jgi:hypothetical protein
LLQPVILLAQLSILVGLTRYLLMTPLYLLLRLLQAPL